MSVNPRFLVDNLNSGVVELSPEESHHITKVVRLDEGASVDLIDGRGKVASATLQSLGKKVKVAVGEVRNFPQTKRVSLAFGIPKSAALDTLLRKATEIGVLSFQPLITDHGLHPKEWNAERWTKVIHEACKQCQDPWFPELHAPKSLQNFLTENKTNIVFCDENQRDKASLFLQNATVHVLVGPEGGWSAKERELLKGAQTLSLGENRLRTDTAGLIALTLVKVQAGEL